MEKSKQKEIPCEKRIHVEYLIDGYVRENNQSSSKIIPKSITNIVSYYYPKMSGHTFKWTINNANGKNLSHNNDSIDSDVFNIGLANKFFLRLKYISDQEIQVDDQDDAAMDNIQQPKLVLNVISFPLPSFYADQSLHVELYFHEAKREHSEVWYQRADNYGYDDFRYNQHAWVMNYDLNRYSLNQLSFTCNINVLKVEIDERFNAEMYQRYNYIARVLSDSMRFIWNITERSMIQSLIIDDIYQGNIQYHSDIYHDMIQLQIGKHEGAIFFQIQCCGYPKSVHRFAIKLELYALAMERDTERDKIKIISSIVTFSYQAPTHSIPAEKANILIDLLNQYQSLSILCSASIIQGYDQGGNPIEVVETKSNTKIAADENAEDTKMDNDPGDKSTVSGSKSEGKWLDHPTKTFIWKITDPEIMNHIRNDSPNGWYNSKIFDLFGYKWFIHFVKSQHQPDSPYIELMVRCMISKGQIHCGITIEIVELGEKMTAYERFGANNNWYSELTPMYLARDNINVLETMTLKITIEMVKDCSGEGFANEDNEDAKNVQEDEEEEKKNDADAVNVDDPIKWLSYPSDSFSWIITDPMIMKNIKLGVTNVNSQIFELMGYQWFLFIEPENLELNTRLRLGLCSILRRTDLQAMITMRIEELDYTAMYYQYYGSGQELSSVPIDLAAIKDFKTLSINVCVEIVRDRIHRDQQKNSMVIEENKNDSNEDDLKEKSKTKWLKYPSESFLWSITDENILNDITNNYNKFDSDLFELFGYRWFITIFKPNGADPDLGFTLNCILDKGKLTCSVKMKIMELNEGVTYYDIFEANTWNQRGKFVGIAIDHVRIKQLKTLTMKLTISMIKDETDEIVKDDDKYKDSTNKMNDASHLLNENIQAWMRTIVNIIIVFVALVLYKFG